jgi:hypothetical protein
LFVSFFLSFFLSFFVCQSVCLSVRIDGGVQISISTSSFTQSAFCNSYFFFNSFCKVCTYVQRSFSTYLDFGFNSPMA